MIRKHDIAKRDAYILDIAASMFIACGSGDAEWKRQRVFVVSLNFCNIYRVIRITHNANAAALARILPR